MKHCNALCIDIETSAVRQIRIVMDPKKLSGSSIRDPKLHNEYWLQIWEREVKKKGKF